jgi:hypothetical protein
MLQNFRVIMKYNPAEAYALAIGHFADRLRGGPPFVQPGRGRNGCCRGPNGSNCSSFWPSAASIAVPRTASSAARPGGAAQLPGLDRNARGRFATSDMLERLRGR